MKKRIPQVIACVVMMALICVILVSLVRRSVDAPTQSGEPVAIAANVAQDEATTDAPTESGESPTAEAVDTATEQPNEETTAAAAETNTADNTAAPHQNEPEPETQPDGESTAPETGDSDAAAPETAPHDTANQDELNAATTKVELPQATTAIALVGTPEDFGTGSEVSELSLRFSKSDLAARTGLDIEVLEKMYTPFYVLDIDYDEMYYPLTSPGGDHGENKIYGGQCGVDVLEIDGNYAKIHAYRYPGGREITGYVPTKMLKQVTPDDRYSIIVDKKQQKLFLFEYGELKEEMLCSSGKVTTETPAGEYIKHGTKDTIYSDADPDIAYYGIHLNGRVYIHSVSQVGGDYSKSISQLGHKASHGCVRVPLDWAKWFYNNIPNGTKVIITEYREEV